MTNGRFDASGGESAGTVDYSSFFCLSDHVREHRAPDIPHFDVRGVGYPLEVRPKILRDRSALVGDRG
ncbi:MAG: hypothetical protein ACRDTS_17470, partial [Mycobacterium sp.]